MDKIVRIIDANLNRGREGLRVIEDLVRFLLDDADLASKIKSARHEITLIARLLPLSESEFMNARDSMSDIGMELNTVSENTRVNIQQIAAANIRRSQEATRVLEELSKIYNANVALQFKRLRFQLYELEKQVLMKITMNDE